MARARFRTLRGNEMTEVAERPDFGRITSSSSPPAPDVRNAHPDYVSIHNSAEFTELRRRFRRFVFPMSALFFIWYLTYVLLAAYARDFMSQKVFGTVHVGLVLGLLQFVSTLAITAAYLRYARRRIDPQVQAIRTKAGAATK
jgi:uncharacterized membrane protein (DUF485 family)